MYFIYNTFINILILFSPLILFFRILKKKEDPKRLLEKFCLYKNKQNFQKLIWFHAASVGELKSIIPIIEIIEKKNQIKKVLITTSTTSSAKIFEKYKFKKTIHKYYPLDSDFITKQFIKFWKPKTAFFVDSEIWPNMIKNLYQSKIPIILINARITHKSFIKWRYFKNFSKKIFGKITLALPSNGETFKYLKKLGVKNIKIAGNLKFFGVIKKKEKKKIQKKFKDFYPWCAASTHKNEESLILKLHKNLKNKENKIITIIIPRHVNRINEIILEIQNNNLNYIKHSSNKKIKKNTDIYLVDTYGETDTFYNLTNVTFLGGSIIKHGGQNPLEPARLGNYIISGPNIKNFEEIYNFLNDNDLCTISSKTAIIQKSVKFNLKKKISSKLISKINNIGVKILNQNLAQIKKYIL